MITKIEGQSGIELPTIFLIENEEDYKKLPRGLPYIIGKQADLKFISIYLTFQVLYKSCTKTGLAINWLKCLERLGYKNLTKYTLSSGGFYDASNPSRYEVTVENFVEDSYIVNFDKLTELKILPVWLDDLRAAVETNIINEVIFDPTLYSKQLGTYTGAGAVKENVKNLLILDVSGSIPRGVVVTITNLAKLMSKKFYADVMITSGETVLIDYENVQETDIVEVARKSGSGNEGQMYKKIVEEPRIYNTVIAFGDDDQPIHYGSLGELKPIWKISTIHSLHTDCKSKNVVGYAKYLTATNTILVTDWVNTIK